MKVLIADPIAEEGIEALRAHAEVDVKLKMGPDELIAAIGDYDAIVVRSETKIPAEAIEAGRKLQVIGRAGVGVDNIDVKAATSKGIMVVNAPTGNTTSAAEHTIAMMLALARHIPQAHSLLKTGEWRRQDFLGCELRNKTLGIVGLGRRWASLDWATWAPKLPGAPVVYRCAFLAMIPLCLSNTPVIWGWILSPLRISSKNLTLLACTPH
jgi:phosphoglycerate dehydrogenase-like enzyme